MLAEYRRTHPQLKQLVFRPGTILGATTSNQITNLFERGVIMGLTSVSTPFVFIWDRDVVACIVKGIVERREASTILAGDGTLTLETSPAFSKPMSRFIGVAVGGASRIAALRLSQYGPEQVNFLRYRPVLANDRLKPDSVTRRRRRRQKRSTFMRATGD